MTPDRSLTRGSLLARNVILNLGGSALPALAALVSVPILIRALGDVRFSVLVLAWTTLGYFSLFDLGIGRAVTHAVADRVGSARHQEIGTAIWTALCLLLPISLLSGVLLHAVASPLATVLSVPTAFRAEAITSFRLIALAIPFAALAGALRGALEAKQCFGAVNMLRIPHGLITFAGPLLALPFSRSVVAAVAVLAVGRGLLLLAHFVIAARVIPEFARPGRRWSGPIARTLAFFGGWTQVTYIVSPIMATLDRFFVGALLGIGVVTYYATPQELVTKIWLFTFAVLPVFFSALSTTATRDAIRTATLFDKLLRFTLAAVFLPAFVLVALAPDILRLWLGVSFETQSTVVLQIMAIAVLVNCVGQGGMTLIHGLGRPDITGKFHLVELPLYLLMAWYLMPRYGILGAALAWSIRMVGDSVLLLAVCPRLLPETRTTIVRMSLWLTGASAVLFASMSLTTTMSRLTVATLVAIAWVMVVWRFLLTPEERQVPLARFLSGALRPEQA